MSRCVCVVGVLVSILVMSRPAEAENVNTDFKTMGTFSTPKLSAGLVDITADDGASSADVYVLNLNGLGVVGGSFDSQTDGSEALHFRFQTFSIQLNMERWCPTLMVTGSRICFNWSRTATIPVDSTPMTAAWCFGAVRRLVNTSLARNWQ